MPSSSASKRSRPRSAEGSCASGRPGGPDRIKREKEPARRAQEAAWIWDLQIHHASTLLVFGQHGLYVCSEILEFPFALARIDPQLRLTTLLVGRPHQI